MKLTLLCVPHALSFAATAVSASSAAPSAGFARFETCGSDFDTVLAVYTGSAVSGLTAVAANDGACDLGSVVTFEATAGTVYQFAVAGYDGEQGAVLLRWSRPEVAPQSIARPALSGTPRDGDTLTSTTGQWNGTVPISYAYAWSRCNGSTCFPIAGAQAASYSLSFADVGWMMRVTVTARNAAGSTQANSLTTAVVAPVAPSNIAIPTVTGIPREGEVLTAGPGTWKGTGTVAFAYQWQACVASPSDCTNLPGETNQTLPLVREHAGSTIRVIVAATNGVGSAQANSASTTAVEGIAPTIVTTPTLRGTPRQGHVLTAQGGTWKGSQPISRAYHWQACNRSGTGCKNLAGKTAPKLLLGAAQVGTRIRVIDVATNVAVATEAPSVATATVTAAQRCVVPKVKGKTLAAARSAVNRVHCTTGHVTNAYSDHVSKGHVVSQSPRAGTRGAAGTPVNLVISRGAKGHA